MRLMTIYCMMKQILTEWRVYLSESKEATYPILKEIWPKIEEYSEVVFDSIVDGEYFFVSLEDSKRVGVILDTTKGRIPFYRSSGKSVAAKEEGEWTIFKGYQPGGGSNNFGIIKKNWNSFNLTQGKDRYLTILALVLEHLWDRKGLESRLTKTDFHSIAKRRIEQINQKIQKLNQQGDKYIQYDLTDLQGAYLNSYLQDKDALNSVVFDSIIPESEYIGLEEIRSEKVTELKVFDKFLPTLEMVMS